jgi:hypothetical protein
MPFQPDLLRVDPVANLGFPDREHQRVLQSAARFVGAPRALV